MKKRSKKKARRLRGLIRKEMERAGSKVKRQNNGKQSKTTGFSLAAARNKDKALLGSGNAGALTLV